MPVSTRHLLFAIVVSVALHLALGAYLYLTAESQPAANAPQPKATAAAGAGAPGGDAPATLADVRRAMTDEAARADELTDAQKADAVARKLGRLNQIDGKSVDQILTAVEAVTGAVKDESRPSAPLGLNEAPGAFDEQSARYFDVDDSQVDPATGRRVVVFTEIDVARRTRIVRVPEDQLTRYQRLQLRALKERTHDDAGNHVNEINLFDTDSGRLYDITQQTDAATGEVTYKLTLLDKNGRTLALIRKESQMTSSDLALYRVFEMKRSNPKLGKLLEAATRIAEAQAARQAAALGDKQSATDAPPTATEK